MTQEALDRANKIISEIEIYRKMLVTLGDYEEIEVHAKKKKGVADSFRIVRTDKSKVETKYSDIMDLFVRDCMSKLEETIAIYKKELEEL